MQPHPRIRKTIKWAGAALTVLLVVAWVGSGWVYVTWGGGAGSIEIRGRRLTYFDNGTLFAPEHPRIPLRGYAISSGEKTLAWGANPLRESEDWLPHWECTRAYRSFSLPLWIPAMGMLSLAVVSRLVSAALGRRRAHLHRCPRCRYDRSGLAASAVCPECGSPPPRHP